MRRWITPLGIVLVLQLALALALSLRRDPLTAVTTDTPLIAATARSADRLVIAGPPAANSASGPAKVELLKKDGGWIMPGYFDAPADAARVNGLIDRLAALKRGLPIATTASALQRFRVADADFERRVVLSRDGKQLGTLYFGESAGLRQTDARPAGERAVYTVDLPTYELPAEPSGWLNGDLLRRQADQLVELDVGGDGHDSIDLTRKKAPNQPAAAWTAPALGAGQQIDSAHVEALARDVAQIHVDGVLGTSAQPDWQQDHPALTLKLQDAASHSIDWTLSKPKNGDFYVLKSSLHPWYFSISSMLAQQIIDAGARAALVVSAKPANKSAGKS